MTALISEVYPWQKTVWKKLSERFPEIGHALLFYGKAGSGKHDFTQHFVAWLLCQHKLTTGACGECVSCQWLRSDTHPNYIHLSVDEDQKKPNAKIKIEKIRELLPFVQQTVEGWRVVVIEPAEALNMASANALLKTLEEPGERIIIILVATHFLTLPATIRSRLQHFALDRITDQEAQDYLAQKRPDLTAQQLKLVMNLTNNMPLKALTVVAESWLELRSRFVSDWTDLVQQKNQAMAFASHWAKALTFTDFMTMFEYLLADLVALKLEQPVKNIDLSLEALAAEYTLEVLFALYDELHRARELAGQNVQTNLILDQLFMHLMNVESQT